MIASRIPTSPGRLTAFACAFAALLALPCGAEPAQAAMLDDLTLEELLEIQIRNMAITGIHHTHDRGEMMLGYSFMHMEMNGNLDGTHSVGRQGVWDDGFMVAPLDMTMDMHMVHVMMAPHDRLTLMLMMPFIEKEMTHQIDPGIAMPFAGEKFRTRSRGPGDLKLTALVSLFERPHHRLIFEGGMSFPTGSVNEEDDVPMSGGMDVRLPYPMQLGSGTFDLVPGMTYIGQVEDWTWGLHSRGTIRLGDNDNDYRLGNVWLVTGWGARALTDFMSASLRLEGQGWMNIHGSDGALNPMMVPTADPDLRAGERLDMLFGVNVFASEGTFEGNRISVEGGLPVYQRLDGPQLETTWMMRVSWEWTFRSFLGLTL